MDNGQVTLPDQREGTLAGWGFKTGFICTIGTVLFARYACGMEWIYSVMLFFPAAGLVNALIINHSGKIFSNALWLAAYPLLIGSAPSLGTYLMENLPAGTKIPAGLEKYLGQAAFAVLYLAAKVLCSIAAITIPDFKIGWRKHRIILVIMRSLGVIMAGCGFLTLLAIIRRNSRIIPANIVPWIAGGAVVLLGFAIFKIRREVDKLGAPGEAGDEKESETLLVERPSIRMNDVAGMNEVKEQIRLRLIEPIRNPKLAEQFGLKVGGGMLLYGPPGTGKTFIAKAVAGELNLPFYAITAADIFGRYVGESEQNLRKLFQSARKNKLSVIFIDELETIFRKRTGEIHEVTQKVISLLLQELDGIGGEGKNPILLLGATNMPWQVDEAFLRPGRFDILAFVDLPDAPARRQIIQHAFDKVHVSPAILDYIASKTDRYSGADLNGVAMRIKQLSFDRRAKNVDIEIVRTVLASSSPSDNREIMEELRKWRSSR